MAPTNCPTIFLSAAEASGDEHGVHLMHAIRRRLGEVRFVGVAGPKMASAGCETLADLTANASMLGGPVLRLRYYYKLIQRLKRQISAIRPDLHVPIDSPALNWHLAKASRSAGAKVVYYIAPQVWAWAPWRVKKLARLTDHVACILPFEQDYLRQRGVNATFVGNPLLDTLPPRPEPMSDFAQAWGLGQWRVALLSGSRPGEIRQHARAALNTARAIRKRWPQAQCVFAAGNEQAAQRIADALAGEDLSAVEIAAGQTREILAQSHFALAVSGTVTLEVAWFGVPMVIFYRVGWLGYNTLGRLLLRTPYLSLVNILARRELVPELMPWYGDDSQVVQTVLDRMEDYGGLFDTRKSLLELMEPLRPPHGLGASDNVAEIIAQALGR